MDFILNTEELTVLYGLPHIQQLTYLRGIRPYMDNQTFIVGIKRKISHTSITEQLYIEPHPGIKAQNFSRDQVRRAVAGLVRVGIVSVLSEDLSLILKCELASVRFSAQNKAAIKPPCKDDTKPTHQELINTGSKRVGEEKTDIIESTKAATPLKDNNFLYIFFEKFWESYPQKKSKPRAQKVFDALNPDCNLFQKIIQSLNAQVQHYELMKARGEWVPAWKYPATWLEDRCWEDEINTDSIQEKPNAEGKKHSRRANADAQKPMFWIPEDTGDDETGIVSGKVIAFKGGS